MRTANGHIRLLIAADERLFREGLRLLLETHSGFDVIGYASEGTETVAVARRLKPDVLLLDVASPGPAALETLQSVASSSVSVRTILITPSVTRADVLSALRHGARGIVLKSVASNLLFKAIHTVMDGQYWIGRGAVSDLVAALRESPPPVEPQPTPRRFKLTPRDLEIVRAIVDGQGNKDIADRLGVAEPTVKHHLTSIYDKIGVSNRVGLALFAVHNKLI